MRYLFGLVCALALGGVGCSQSLGPVGEGGAGGDGGNGGIGGTMGQEFPCTEQGIRDAIAEGGGPHKFDCNGPRNIVTENEIFIDNDVILDGEGQLTLDGDGEHPVFVSPTNVNDPPPTAELRGFRITGAPDVFLMSTLYGVYVAGDAALTLRDCTVFENQGDGIRVDGGTLTLVDSSVSDNGATGIVSQGGSLTIMNSTVSDNDTNVLSSTGPLTMVNSTISGGEVGVSNFGQMSVRNSTIVSEGSAFETSDGDYDPPPQAVLTNTIVAGACQGDAPSYVTSGGHNIESPGDTCGFDPDGTDQVNVSAEDLNLGSLAENGGPTMTHALLTEPEASVAIDLVPNKECLDAEGKPLMTDQRGLPRPGGTSCDAGAFEVQGVPVTDCTGFHDGRICTVGDSPGLCFEEVCRLSDCSGLADGTRCAQFNCTPFPGGCLYMYGWCWNNSCGWVGDCTVFEDLTPCAVYPNTGFCIDGSCEPAVSVCVGEQDGTLCMLGFPVVSGDVIPKPGGFCVDGECEKPQ